MVKPGEEHGATSVPIDEMELPERLGHVERGAHQVADQRLESLLVARRRERHPVQVGVDVEAVVVHPAWRADPEGCLDHLLPEAVEGEQPLLEGCAELARIERFVENQDPGDHHQVGRVLHPEPRRVNAGEGLGHA